MPYCNEVIFCNKDSKVYQKGIDISNLKIR